MVMFQAYGILTHQVSREILAGQAGEGMGEGFTSSPEHPVVEIVMLDLGIR